MQTRGSKTRQNENSEGSDLERLDSGFYVDFPERKKSSNNNNNANNNGVNPNTNITGGAPPNMGNKEGGFGGAFRRFIKKRPSRTKRRSFETPLSRRSSKDEGILSRRGSFEDKASDNSTFGNSKMTPNYTSTAPATTSTVTYKPKVGTTTAAATSATSAKPRRRRGSDAMPGAGGGGQKLPTSAELMAMKSSQAPPSTTQTYSTATTSTTTATKSTKPRGARRGSDAMPPGAGGGQKMPTSAELMAMKQQQPTTYTTAATSDPPPESSAVPVTMKMGGKKPAGGGRRRGSHAFMPPAGQKMPTSAELMAQKQQAAAGGGVYGGSGGYEYGVEPMETEDETIVTAKMSVPTPITAKPKSNRRRGSDAFMPQGGQMKLPTSAELMAQKEAALASSAPQDYGVNDGPSPMDTSESCSGGGGGRRGARRRGSVVKTMVDSGPKSVDGDGEHVATASAKSGEDIDSSMKFDESMMSIDDANDYQNQSAAALPQTTRMMSSAVDKRQQQIVGESTRNLGAGGKKKDRGRKAIRAVAADLDYVHKVVPKSSDARELIYEAIKPNILFRACSVEELYDLVDAFEPQDVSKGSVVIQEGDEGDHFYVMERGGVDVYEKDEHKCSLYSGVAFGEIALLYSCPRTATVQAKYDCKLWVINRRAFRGITAQHKKRRLELKSDFLKKVKIHDKVLGDILKPSEINSMALATKVQKFKAGNAIVRQGERGDAFYMIEEGKVDVYINEKGARPIVTLQSGSFFGEKALLSSDVRTATCVAASEVKCMLIGREDFVLMLGNLQDLLDRSYIARDEALREKASQEASAFPTTKRFNMSDYDIKRTLGVGAFGFVKLVQWKKAPIDTKKDAWYALKCVSKQKIEQHKQQEKIKREEEIMSELIHPFIARLYSGMEDEKGKYFLMEALCGGELCELLYNETQFTEKWSLFYSASVLSAFGHMHERKIAYRDLKPENLVLDTYGYVKIVDFGLAKKVISGQTYTFCGTPDYLAPEVILNEGYDWGVDYWGLGVLIYEMTAGVAPFYAESPMETYEKALSGHVHMPSHFSRSAANLIKKLLHTSQAKRLGRTVGGATTVMCHPWFSNFDWDALMECRLKPPYMPELRDPDDNSSMYEEEQEGFATAFF